jgi:hypothetical protein
MADAYDSPGQAVDVPPVPLADQADTDPREAAVLADPAGAPPPRGRLTDPPALRHRTAAGGQGEVAALDGH